jgi:hypothetical protein
MKTIKNKKFFITLLAGLVLVAILFAGVMFFLITKSGNDYGKVIHCREIKCSSEDFEECFKKCLNED